MKKIASLLTLVLLLTSCFGLMCSCEGKEEREYRKAVAAAKAAEEAADRAQKEYNDLLDWFD